MPEKYITATGKRDIPPETKENITLTGTVSWNIKDGKIRFKITPKITVAGSSKTPQSIVHEVTAVFDGKRVTGIYGAQGWTIDIPSTYKYDTDLTILPVVKFKVDRGPRYKYSTQFILEAMEKYPLIKYVIGLDGFAVSRMKEGNSEEYRAASFKKLVSIAVAIPDNPNAFVYDWSSMKKMTKNDYRQFAMLKRWSVIENIWEAKEDLGKEYLKKIFDEMEKEETLSRVYQMNTVTLVILNSFQEAFEFILPDPEENFTEMVAGAKTMFDDTKTPMERVIGGFSMVAHAVFLVLDFLPVIGKVGKAAKILKKTDGVLEAILRHLMKERRGLRKVLQGTNKLDNTARKKLDDAARELDDKIKSLEELRSKLNKPPDQLSDMEADMLQDSLELIDEAKKKAQKAKEAGLVDDAVKDTDKLVTKSGEKKQVLDDIAEPYKPLTAAERKARIRRNITRLAIKIENAVKKFQKTPEFKMLLEEKEKGNKEAIKFFEEWVKWRQAWKNRKNLKLMGPAFRWKIMSIEDGKLVFKDWTQETRRAILTNPGTPRWVKGFYQNKYDQEIMRLRAVIASGNNNGGRITKARKALTDMLDPEKKLDIMLKKFSKLPPGYQLGHRHGDKMGQLPGVLEDAATNGHKGRKYGL